MGHQIDTAYDDICREVQMILARDPKAHFVFFTTGFSRGAAATRVLNNRLLNVGILNPDSNPLTSGSILVPSSAVVVGASVIFDTVVSDFKAYAGAQYAEVPDPSAFGISPRIRQVLHITAMNEYREFFPLTPAVGRNVAEVQVPGAHSDIGGSYQTDGLSAVTLRMARNFFIKAGLPLTTEQEMKTSYLPHTPRFIIHDPRIVPKLPWEQQLQQMRQISRTDHAKGVRGQQHSKQVRLRPI